MRQRPLERAALALGSEVVMRQGMRSWIEGGCPEELRMAPPAPGEGRFQPERGFQPIVALWASVLVGLAERSCGGQRNA